MTDDHQSDDAGGESTESLGSPEGVRRIASRMAAIAREGVPGVDHASVCVRHPNGRLETVAATGSLTYHADCLQYDLNEGPAYDAVTDQDVVYSPDLALDARWPSFGPQAGALGMHSLLAIRLLHLGRLYLVLNLYSSRCGAFENHRDIVVHTFSSHARDAFGQPQEVDTLSTAAAERMLLDRASGLMMHRHGLDEAHARELLVLLAEEPGNELAVADTIIKGASSRTT